MQLEYLAVDITTHNMIFVTFIRASKIFCRAGKCLRATRIFDERFESSGQTLALGIEILISANLCEALNVISRWICDQIRRYIILPFHNSILPKR